MRRQLLVAVLAVSIGGNLGAAERPVIRIGHSESTVKGKGRSYAEISAHLDKSTKYRYEIVTFDDAEALYDAFRKNQVQAANLGPILYVRAHTEVGAVPVIGEGKSYQSVIFVADRSPIQKLADLKGKKFAFGHKESTSSYMYPMMLLQKAGVREQDLGKAEYVGAHQKVVEAVIEGRADVGAAIDGAVAPFLGKGLRAIATSPPIPGVPLVVHKEADPAFVADLKERMLSFKLGHPDRGVAFAEGAVVVTDADYNEIRFLAKVVLGKDYR